MKNIAISVVVFLSLLATQVAAAELVVEPESREIRHLLAADVSAERIEKDIRKLVGFGTRHTLSETESDTRGIGAARRWVEQEFRNISRDCGGCLEVFTVGAVISGERRIPLLFCYYPKHLIPLILDCCRSIFLYQLYRNSQMHLIFSILSNV